MSQLQIALAVLALVVLAGLFAKGKWDERRARARLKDLQAGVGDPLLGGGTAPAGAAAAAPESAAPAMPAARGTERIEPTLGEIGGEHALAEAALAAPVQAGSWVEDPLLDFALELRCAKAVDGVTALAAAAQLGRLRLPLPAHLAVWDARVQHWGAPDRFGFYSEMLVALQLADRHGALSEIDASRFLAAVQQIALELDAEFDPPDMPQLMAQAQALDATVARFDVQLSLTLRSPGAPFAIDAIRAAAAAVGFEPAGEGRWQRGEGEGAARPLVLVAETPLAAAARLTLDVPIAPIASQPLEGLFATANDLAARLGAAIVDDMGRAIASGAAVAINQQLAQLYQQMHDAGIEPGSDRARRLYTAARVA